jgi:predicted DNA binding CopG/RHH family protein
MHTFPLRSTLKVTKLTRSYNEYGPQTRRNMFLPDDLVENLKTIATQKGVTYSELVRKVLTAYARKLAK